MNSSLFDQVYKETGESYERLEQNPLLNNLFQGKLTTDEYKGVLVLFYRFYSLYEYRLVQAGTGNLAGALFYTHLKTPLLEADLGVLEYPLSRSPLPAFPGLSPQRLERPESLGVWFILEKAPFIWSRLTKVLKRKYGIDAASGLAFFTNYANRFEYFWEEFLDFLSNRIVSADEQRRFTRAANQTLLSLDSCLRQEHLIRVKNPPAGADSLVQFDTAEAFRPWAFTPAEKEGYAKNSRGRTLPRSKVARPS